MSSGAILNFSCILMLSTYVQSFPRQYVVFQATQKDKKSFSFQHLSFCADHICEDISIQICSSM